MSNEAVPIPPHRFAAALKDLPLSTLHLKAAELRNSIAHLDYSNEQLKPFAEGTEPGTNGVPDQDCVEAIRENGIVIARMQERITLLKAEVEGRGSSWLEFQSAEESAGRGDEEMVDGEGRLVNGTSEDTGGRSQEMSEAWRDGTFQTGSISNGEIVMHGPGAGAAAGSASTNSAAGGRLDDDALRRAMEERIRALSDNGDEGEGMHL